MKIHYDREEDILSIELRSHGEIDHADQVDSIIIHMSQEGEALHMEILDASEFLSTALRTALQKDQEEISSLAE